MTIVHLLKAVKSLVSEALEHASFELDGDGEPEGFKRPNIYLGYLPYETIPEGVPAGAQPLVNTDAKQEPFVIIRAATGEDEAYEVDTAKVHIVVGTESYSEQGYMDVLHIFELIRFAIARKHFIANLYEPLGKVKWTLPEEQPWPVWNGIIETTWSLPGVEKEDLFDA